MKVEIIGESIDEFVEVTNLGFICKSNGVSFLTFNSAGSIIITEIPNRITTVDQGILYWLSNSQIDWLIHNKILNQLNIHSLN
jgi:hypothetical protein